MKDYNKYSDEKLLGLLRENKPLCDQAFYVLYNRYSLKLNTYCMFNCKGREAAEDVFQETWLRFDRTVKSGKNIGNVLAFLITVSRNIIIDKFRRKQSAPLIAYKVDDVDPLENIPDIYSPDYDMDKDELIGLIQVAADSLDEKYKEVFVLKRFCDMSYKEIAALTGQSVDSAKKRSSRAMQMVKDILKPYIKELS